MMHWRKYTQFILIGFREATVYRLNAVMGFVTSALYLLMSYAIWKAIASSGTLEGGFASVMIYLVAARITYGTAFQSVEHQLGDKIQEGHIVNELKRPISLRGQVFFKLLGQAAFGFMSISIPMYFIGAVFLGLQLPGAFQLGAYAVSLLLAFTLHFMLSYATSMIIFWTKIGWSIRMMRSTVQNVFSGVLFPLYLLPTDLRVVFDALPFRAMIDTPVTIFRGDVTGTGLLEAYGLQLFWVLVLFVIGELLWRRARTKLTVQGG